MESIDEPILDIHFNMNLYYNLADVTAVSSITILHKCILYARTWF